MFGYNPDFSGSQVGGGFLNTPGIANQGNSSGTKSGQRGESCLMPVTIKQITTAPEPDPDAPFMIDGKDSFNVTVLGAITHIEIQSTNTAVTISDGTDEIAVKIWASEEGRLNSDLEKMKDLQKGSYIKIFGRPQLYRGTRSINCYHLDIVKDSNELTLHLVEALYAHLMNKNINNAKQQLNSTTSVSVNNENNNTSNSSVRNTTNPSVQAPSGNNATSKTNTSHLSSGIFSNNGDMDFGIQEENEMSELDKKIIAVVKNPIYLATDGGCHIDDVFKVLKDIDMNDIKEAIQRLSDDGQLYSTIDDEHYKPTH